MGEEMEKVEIREKMKMSSISIIELWGGKNELEQNSISGVSGKNFPKVTKDINQNN